MLPERAKFDPHLLFHESSPYLKEVQGIDRNSPRGIIVVNNLANKIFSEDESFSQARQILGDDPQSINTVVRAAVDYDFPAQSLLSQIQNEALLTIASQKEELSRQIILQFVEKGVNFGLEPYELEVLKTSCQLGNLYDELCLKWRKNVIYNPHARQAFKDGLTNPYSVITTDEGGENRQVSWIEAYPDEVTAIATGWRDCVQKIEELSTNNNSSTLANYFQTYADAFESQDLKTLEEQWRNIDRVWMGIEGRLHPIASREYSYYDPDSTRVFPDFRLGIVNEIESMDIEGTRQAVKTYAEKHFGSTRVYKETANAIDTVNVYPIFDAVFTGALDFKPVGQSLPNEQVVQQEHGTKTFLNLEATERRWQLAIELARKVFPHRIGLFQKIDCLRDKMMIDVGGHEFAEPLYQTDTVRKQLGEDFISLLNEDLANLSITAALPEHIEAKGLSPEILQNHAISLLGAYLRYLDIARGRPHLQPYYKLGLLGLKRMLDTGFIYKKDGIWDLNLESLDGVYQSSQRDLARQVVEIAEKFDIEDAGEYLSQGEETEPIQDLIRIINPQASFD